MEFHSFSGTEPRQDSPSAGGQKTPSVLSLLLHPGIGIKRWALVASVGLICLALGIAFLLPIPISPQLLTVARSLTMSWLPPMARGIAFLVLGILLVLASARHFYSMVVDGVLGGRQTKRLLLDLQQHRTQMHGPKVVAIGGGTALSILLRGLKLHTRNITAVVTVADDGGSSGRLRNDLAIPPPGDARNCLVALSNVEPLMESLMQYRFPDGAGLQGHNLGNLLLAALTDLEGDFSRGLEAAVQLLGVNGHVFPSTLATDVVLYGTTQSGQVVRGESKVGTSQSPLIRVWLTPEHLQVNPAVTEAVLDADIIVIGPGSLYTSIIPNFLVHGIREALQSSVAPKIFVCNVATQPGETEDYGVAEHMQAFYDHSGIPITHLIVNSNVEALPIMPGPVAVEPKRPTDFKGRFMTPDVVDDAMRTRHDSAKLARSVMEIAKNPRIR